MPSEQSQPVTPLDLAQFTGSETVFRHPLSGCLYTEGVQYLAEKAGAYWLIDAILLPQRHEACLRAEKFQVWQLSVREGRTAFLSCTNGDELVVYAPTIPWTDFPMTEMVLWFANDTLYLPSEH